MRKTGPIEPEPRLLDFVCIAGHRRPHSGTPSHFSCCLRDAELNVECHATVAFGTRDFLDEPHSPDPVSRSRPCERPESAHPRHCRMLRRRSAFHLWTPPSGKGKRWGRVARGRMLSSVRPLMRQDDSRRPVWEFADRVQITHSVLEAQWKALVVPAPSRRLLRHTLLPLALTSSRSWSAYAAAVGVL